MSKSSIAFHNLRGLTILLVVAFHSVMAYLAYNPAPHPHYEMPPLFSDTHRWIGFDLFCATQYVFLMQLMFLLSGLFVWPSLVRRGGASFLYNQFLRLGVPFVIGLYLLIPAAHVPVYLLTARDPTLAGYWAQWTSLPVWPIGHLWFLSALLALDVAAAALYWFAPAAAEHLGRISAHSKEHPFRYFFALLAISAVAYVPLSMKFEPWQWTHIGPFEFQTSYVLMYVVYFFAGLGIGAFGLEASLFAASGRLPQCWKIFTSRRDCGVLSVDHRGCGQHRRKHALGGNRIDRLDRFRHRVHERLLCLAGYLPALLDPALCNPDPVGGQCLGHLFLSFVLHGLASVPAARSAAFRSHQSGARVHGRGGSKLGCSGRSLARSAYDRPFARTLSRPRAPLRLAHASGAQQHLEIEPRAP